MKFNNKDELKNFLNKHYELNKMKKILKRRYKQMQKEVGEISIETLEIKGNSISSKVENEAINLIQLKNEIELYSIKILESKKEINALINKVDDEILKTLLKLRYIELKKWYEIEQVFNYSNRYILKLHNKALEKLL